MSGCVTFEKVAPEPEIDLDAPFTVSIYQGEKLVSPEPADEAALSAVLRDWLPKMQVCQFTFPTPGSRLLLEGKNKEGTDAEMTVFVGYDWIGDGVGITTLEFNQAYSLWHIINNTTVGKPW